MDKKSVVYTTLAISNGKVEDHILAAVQRNCSISNISKIIIVTESKIEDLLNLNEIFSHDKVRFKNVIERPTFSTMLSAINHSQNVSSNEVSFLMNADISANNESSISDTCNTLEFLLRKGVKQPCFILTRYDQVNGRPQITLKNNLNMPNLMSSDVWVFTEAVTLETDAFYCLGQMFCDQFFVYDLYRSGLSIFNPCLDIMFIHHEQELKRGGYYKKEANTFNSKQRLIKHWGESVIKGDSYIGIPRVTTRWLLDGYLPNVVSASKDINRIYIFCSEHCLFDQIEFMKSSVFLYKKFPNFELGFITESIDISNDIVTYLTNSQLEFSVFLVDSLNEVSSSIRKGGLDSYKSVVLKRSFSAIPDALTKGAVCFVDVRKNSRLENFFKKAVSFFKSI